MQGKFGVRALGSLAWTAIAFVGCASNVDVEAIELRRVQTASAAMCPNNMLDPGETCDDGNTSNGDGCSTSCQTEVGWTCGGAPSVCTCDSANGYRMVASQCVRLDFGDAPASYGVFSSDDGARHVLVNGGPMLGPSVTFDPDGLASPNAGADIDNGCAPAALMPGTITTFPFGYTTTAPATVTVWVDFNRNGNFTDAGDFAGSQIVNGTNVGQIGITTPANASPGLTFMRLRIATQPANSPIGLAADGEVEDFQIPINTPSTCGDGNLDPGEDCDPPSADGANLCGCKADCTFPSAATVCRAPSCSNGMETDQANCTGSSPTCPSISTKLCGAYACGTSACKTTCAGPADCAPGNTCVGNACQPSGPVCGNGIVEAGEQCEPGASGPCACKLDCNFPPPGTSCGAAPTSACDFVFQCDGAGVCQSHAAVVGTVCRAAASECDVAEVCDGVTSVCPADASRAGQNCGPVPTGDCDVQDTCTGSLGAAATCTAKFKDGTSSCRPATCTSGFETIAASCTGSSTDCPAITTHACAPYACGATACKTTCAGPADCAPDHECQGTTCVPMPGALIITPQTANAVPRGAVAFSATGGATPYTFDLAGNASNGTIGTDGAYIAGSKGSVTDVVRVTDKAGKTQTALVQVGPGISITPSSGTIALGGTKDFSAVGGNGGPYTWHASAGTIDTTGHFTAPNASGSVTIDTSDSLGNTASVVFAVGTGIAITKNPAQTFPKGTVQFTASGGSQTGFTWSVITAPAAGGSIVAATGVFTAGATGGVTETIKVTDSVGGTATATIDVGPALSITPASATAKPGDHISFSAAGGSGMGVSFSLEASPSGGTLDATGVYIAGTIKGTDVVKIVDSVGNVARANITVSGAEPPDAGSSGGDAGSPGNDAGTSSSSGSGSSSSGSVTPPPGAAEGTTPGAINVGAPGDGGDDCSMHGPSRKTGGTSGALLAITALALARRRRR